MSAAAESLIESLRPSLLSLLKAIPDHPAAFAGAIEALAGRNDPDVWQGLVACASQHGVLGVIDRPLTAQPQLPPEVRETTERQIAIDQLWQDHMARGLEDAVGTLAQGGVKACAMKGPVLAARLYPASTIRHCLDIDLLVRPADLDRAMAALTQAGYTTDAGVSATYKRRHAHHLGFSRPATAPIELHFRTYAGFGVVLSADVLFERAEPFRLNDQLSVLAPTPDDEFLYLATHAAGHSFIRLVWLYDLKLLVGRYPSLDWDRIARRAEELGVATPIAYTTRLLHDWLGVSAGDLSTHVRRRGVRTRMADWLLPEVSRPQPASARDNFGGLLFTSLLCDRVRSGAWLLQHHLLRSTRRRLKKAAPAYLPEDWSA
jgi:putative nucleotidyltransferase-like protein